MLRQQMDAEAAARKAARGFEISEVLDELEQLGYTYVTGSMGTYTVRRAGADFRLRGQADYNELTQGKLMPVEYGFTLSQQGAIHVINFWPEYLRRILSGDKPVGSRLKHEPPTPDQMLNVEDTILLRETGGLVVATATIGRLMHFPLDAHGWNIVKHYKEQIKADEEYWQLKQGSKYAILFWPVNIQLLTTPFAYPLDDERSWVTIRTSQPA